MLNDGGLEKCNVLCLSRLQFVGKLWEEGWLSDGDGFQRWRHDLELEFHLSSWGDEEEFVRGE